MICIVTGGEFRYNLSSSKTKMSQGSQELLSVMSKSKHFHSNAVLWKWENSGCIIAENKLILTETRKLHPGQTCEWCSNVCAPSSSDKRDLHTVKWKCALIHGKCDFTGTEQMSCAGVLQGRSSISDYPIIRNTQAKVNN